MRRLHCFFHILHMDKIKRRSLAIKYQGRFLFKAASRRLLIISVSDIPLAIEARVFMLAWPQDHVLTCATALLSGAVKS